MNKHLQKLLQIILQNDELNAEQKNEAIKSLKDADKELEVTAFKLDRTEKVKHTTEVLLEETIAELEQKRKAVELQNRELEIEAALEKVRSRSLAMHNSAELSDTAKLLFDQLKQLGAELWTCGFAICEPDNASVRKWMASPLSGQLFESILIPSDADKHEQSMYDAWKNGVDIHSFVQEGDELAKRYDKLRTPPYVNENVRQVMESGIPLPVWQVSYVIPYKHGYLLIIATKAFDETQIFMRFAKVFEQTYTRFLDLQKAEAQAREAQIEAALEKVRSASMAMHKSDELSTVIKVVSEQLQQLNIKFHFVTFATTTESDDYDFWIAMRGIADPVKLHVPFINNPIGQNIKQARLEGKKFLEDVIDEEKNSEWYNHLFKFNPGLFSKQIREYVLRRGMARSIVIMPNIILVAGNYASQPYDDEDNTIIKRFAAVFEQAYTRFFDLQKAEAQAREAQIEAALERVRAKTMAMHTSHELLGVCKVVFDQFTGLGFDLDSVSFSTDYNGTNFILWSVTDSIVYPEQIVIPFFDHPIFNQAKEVYKEGMEFWTFHMNKEEKNIYFRHLFEKSNATLIPQERKDYVLKMPGYAHSIVLAKNIWVVVSNLNGIPFSEEQNSIVKRFGYVFEQSYTRFLDLQKAEAQAREGQIQLAMERVRARTMAMQKSDELPEAANLLFQQVQSLGMPAWSAGYCIWDDDKKAITLWMSSEGVLQPPFKLPLTEDPSCIHFLQAHLRGETFYVEEIGGEELISHYKYMRSLPVVGEVLQSINDAGFPLPTFQIFHCAYFSKGFLLFITYEPLPKAHDIFKRFGKVFDQTYTRFLDLQKAEAQAREAKIEVSLERIRSKAQAMRNSEDLLNVVSVVREQMRLLGQPELESSLIYLYPKGVDYMEAWYEFHPTVGSPDRTVRDRAIIPIESSAWSKETYQKYLSNEKEYTVLYNGPKLAEWYKVLQKVSPLTIDYDHNGEIIIPDKLYYHFSKFSGGALLLISNTEPLNDSKDLQQRAASTFEIAFSRYNDLKLAEAQAREAQIEAALERVRSRSMGMQKSEELKDVIKIVYQQLIHSKINLDHAGFVVDYTPRGDWHFWIADEQDIPSKITHPYFESVWATQFNEAKENGTASFITHLNFEEKNKFYQELLSYVPGLPQVSKDFYLNCSGLAATTVLFENVSLYMENFSGTPYSDEENKILYRFGKVFQQTYTRFLDLQKVEAQAREAQIAVALERIRAKALAMQTSKDLLGVANVLREQMGSLGQPDLESSIVHLYNESEETLEAWYAYRPPNRVSDEIITDVAHAPKHSSGWTREVMDNYKSEKTEYTIVASGEKIREWYKVLEAVAPAVVEYDNQGLLVIPEILYYHFSKFSGGALLMISNQEPSLEARELQRRAAVVFDLAYTRFLDLKNAEAQAREAKIEASLERVRSKAMAMHSSADLMATINSFYHELELFSITPRRCGVGLLDKDTHMAELSTMNTTDQGSSIEIIGRVKLVGHPVLEAIYENWLLQNEYHPVLRGNEVKEYYQLIRPQIAFTEYPNDAIQFGYFFYFAEGGVYAWTEKELTDDELKIYRRFTSVMSLTYKRYKDLKDAEARAQLAVRESSLDRVRAGIASMRTAEDLQRITPLVWHELIALGVPFFRCGVFIINEEEEKIHVYLSTPQGKPLAALHLGLDSSELNKNAVANWRLQKVYTTHWDKEQFIAFAQSLIEQRQIETTTSYQGGDEPPGSLTLQFIPFAQGMLYVGSAEPLSATQIELVQALTEAFSVAYARYEDFTKLELAKQQIEKTLIDLKQTQTQLIQSEKMASLGELTAGIAHEIQNPLNFVNNFSEVSNELLDEMKEEINKGNYDEVKAITDDVKQNLEKILHHGKRADGIVKGMLQHSRSSSGQKERTDINALADEYLRLAYHGLRAKDKSFNATMKTDFDSSIGTIHVVPQDMGRVILNLITNAFYTVNEKAHQNIAGYEPTVSVSTKKEGNKVLISVKDNGNGIPQKVIDKIFQPFFTTKPTGQGTGLGLSLSYDIVKAHSGELKVDTKEGEGSEFSIQLSVV